ncbi:hypothetical protein J25TS5_02510 [Paenibacillus faecis]|nr:hypothetical protein J25TS5_02510 [Paenibacillus faecis]
MPFKLPDDETVGVLVSRLDPLDHRFDLRFFLFRFPGDWLQKITSLSVCLYNNSERAFCDMNFAGVEIVYYVLIGGIENPT